MRELLRRLFDSFDDEAVAHAVLYSCPDFANSMAAPMPPMPPMPNSQPVLSHQKLPMHVLSGPDHLTDPRDTSIAFPLPSQLAAPAPVHVPVLPALSQPSPLQRPSNVINIGEWARAHGKADKVPGARKAARLTIMNRNSIGLPQCEQAPLPLFGYGATPALPTAQADGVYIPSDHAS